MEENEEHEEITGAEERDRTSQRWLIFGVTFFLLLTIFSTVWIMLAYNQAQLLEETIKAILYVVAGIGSALIITRLQGRR